MVRGAGWDEEFCCCLIRWCLLAWGGCFDFRRLCTDVTHPRPLSRGEIWMLLFSLVNEWVECEVSPLERG